MYDARLEGIFEDSYDWDVPDTLQKEFIVDSSERTFKSGIMGKMKERLEDFEDNLNEHMAELNLKIVKLRRHVASHSYLGFNFTAEQYREILRAKEFGVDPAIIADPDYQPEQMRLVAEAVGAGYEYKFYNPSMDVHKLTLLNTFQMLAPNYDVIRLADLPADKIKVILKGYMEGISIESYAADYSAEQMEEILLCKEKGLDSTKIEDARLSSEQMNVLIEHMDLGLNVTEYNQPENTIDEMDSKAFAQLRSSDKEFLGTITKEDDRNNLNIVDRARHNVYLRSDKHYSPERDNRAEREEVALYMYKGMMMQDALDRRESAVTERQEAIKEKSRGKSL